LLVWRAVQIAHFSESHLHRDTFVDLLANLVILVLVLLILVSCLIVHP